MCFFAEAEFNGDEATKFPWPGSIYPPEEPIKNLKVIQATFDQSDYVLNSFLAVYSANMPDSLFSPKRLAVLPLQPALQGWASSSTPHILTRGKSELQDLAPQRRHRKPAVEEDVALLDASGHDMLQDSDCIEAAILGMPETLAPAN